MNCRVTDGDLLLVTLPKDTGAMTFDKVKVKIEEWIANKGLTNVTTMFFKGGDSPNITFSTLTVNDPFEEKVLKS